MTAVDPLSESQLRPGLASRLGAVSPSLLVFAGLVLLAVGVFWPSITGLAELWSHPDRRTYQHGYLIVAIALWLLMRERLRLAATVGRPSGIMFGLAAAGSLAWAVAWNAGLQTIHFLLWPAILWAAAAGALGLRAGGVLFLPIAYLYFALPVWDALVPGLQDATVVANRLLAAVFGVPMLIEGTYIHIPEGSFEIAGGCSGLNYLVVGLAIATLLGEINRDGPRRRLLLIALGGGLALFSNWLRVFIIIVAGHLSDMQHYLVRVDHYNFGWVLFAFVLAGFFLIVRRLPSSSVQSGAAKPRVLPVVSRAGAIAVASLAIVIGPLLTLMARLPPDSGDASQAARSSQLDFDATDNWQASSATGAWVPVFPGADSETLVEFTRGEDQVMAYTATYLRQSQGRELIGHDSRIEGRAEGNYSRQKLVLAVSEPPIEVIEAEWRDAGGARSLLWWTYQVGGRRFTNRLAAQLWYGVASLVTAPVSSVVALRAGCNGDCESARRSLERYAQDALPEFYRTGDP